MGKEDVRLAGVVTLYNPTDEDLHNIDTYINDVDKLFIVDNTEGRSNEDRIRKSKKIEYIWSGENIGVASALNLAAKKAKKEGFEWLLTNDQDTTFPEGVVNGLKADIKKLRNSKIALITPWHKTKLKARIPRWDPDYPHDVMTSGNVLNLRIWEKLGGFKDWLFIDCVDIEYCLNLRSHGYKIFRDNSLVIEHNLGDLFYRRIPHRVFLCTNHPPIRRYYMMRNAHYLFDEYKKTKEGPYCLQLAAAQKHNMIGVLLFERKKWSKLKMYVVGYMDYRKGIKGKFIPRKERKK